MELADKKSRSFSTLIVMGCTLITRVLGFVKIAAINAIFGASGQADVLNAVFSIPNNLRKLMAEGALSSAFIPELNRHLTKNDQSKAVMLSRTILGFQYVILIPLTLIAIFFSIHVISIFIDFKQPAEQELAAHLFKYFAPYLLLVSISAVLMAVLNSHGQFLVSGLSPLLFSIAVIGAIFILTPTYGIYSMAIGVLIGGLLQIIIQIFPFKKLGYSIKPYFNFNDPSFKIILRHWLPVLLTSSIFAINQQISVYLASGLESGSSSALQNAIVFFNLPYGIFSASVNTVYFPKMSRLAHNKDRVALNESLTSGLTMLMLFLIPSILIMTLLSKEIVSVAFMRGAFTQENSKLAASTLVGFCSGMFFIAAYNFMQRYFYSQGSFTAPFISAIVICIIDIILSLILIKTSLGVAGLAYANSISFTISLIILVIIAKVKYGLFNYRALVLPFIKVTLSCSLAYLLYLLLAAITGDQWWINGSTITNFLYLLLYGSTMSGMVLLGYRIFKIDLLEDLKGKKK